MCTSETNSQDTNPVQSDEILSLFSSHHPALLCLSLGMNASLNFYERENAEKSWGPKYFLLFKALGEIFKSISIEGNLDCGATLSIALINLFKKIPRVFELGPQRIQISAVHDQDVFSRCYCLNWATLRPSTTSWWRLESKTTVAIVTYSASRSWRGWTVSRSRKSSKIPSSRRGRIRIVSMAICRPHNRVAVGSYPNFFYHTVFLWTPAIIFSAKTQGGIFCPRLSVFSLLYSP